MIAFFYEHESITFMSKEAFHKQIFHYKLSNPTSISFCFKKFFFLSTINKYLTFWSSKVYTNAKVSFDWIKKGPIYRTLNQGSRIFQNVTKSTVFTT